MVRTEDGLFSQFLDDAGRVTMRVDTLELPTLPGALEAFGTPGGVAIRDGEALRPRQRTTVAAAMKAGRRARMRIDPAKPSP